MKSSRPASALLLGLSMIVAPSARSTGMLSYTGPGYAIELEIGDDTAPVVASVKVTPPHEEPVVMPPGTCTTTEFNPRRKRLVLRCPSRGPSAKAFSLSVLHRHATLSIAGKVHRWSQFQWAL